MKPKYQKQLDVVYEIAASYWNVDLEHNNILRSIRILNRTGSKIVCHLPKFEKYNECICKVYFSGEGYQNERKGYQLAISFDPIGNIRIPKILIRYPEKQAILSEKISFHDSRMDLLKIFRRNQRINWKDIGVWLRNFHDAEKIIIGDNTFFNQEIRRMESQLAKLKNLIPQDQIENIVQKIDDAKLYMKSNPIDWVISHGDFGLGNIKWSGINTFIIDFENVCPIPREYEVIKFLGSMQSTVYFLFRSKKYFRFSKAFLDGYDYNIKANPINQMLYLSTKLELLTNYQKKIEKPGFCIERIAYKFLLKKLLNLMDRFFESDFDLEKALLVVD